MFISGLYMQVPATNTARHGLRLPLLENAIVIVVVVEISIPLVTHAVLCGGCLFRCHSLLEEALVILNKVSIFLKI